MNKIFIIAEVGVNHNADLNLAYRLIDEASKSGVDAVKFQTSIPELLVTSYAQKAAYQNKTTVIGESQLEMIRKLTFPLEIYKKLKKYCEEKEIIFFSTAFDLVSLDFLEGLGQEYHKIPSGEITNLPYLRQIGQYSKPVFLSTGMSTLGEIQTAIEALVQAGTARSLITVLHCTTEYPAPLAEVNLLAMQSMQETFGVAVGYSDHTVGIEVAIAAAALGASVIEKHFTLDRNLPGPDHKASLEPDELKAMVSAIRNIEIAMGDGIKRVTPSEVGNKLVVRKSLVASKAIKVGEVFSIENITTKRPGTGISPMNWDSVMGRKSVRDFAVDELIEL